MTRARSIADDARGGTPREGPRGDGELRLGVAGRLDLRWAIVELGAVAEEARRRHDLSPIAATALGRALAGVALLDALATRACRRTTLSVRGDGPLGTVVAEIRDGCDLRGSVGEPRLDLPSRPDGELPIGEAIGRGQLVVERELADGSTGESRVSLVTGELGLDLAHYLEQSEQTPSAVSLGVLAGPEGVRVAGGFLVEAIPAADDAAISVVERNLAGLGSVSRRLADEGIDGCLGAVFRGLETEERERRSVGFRCGCSRAALVPRLRSLSAEEREAIALEDGTLTAQCAFCSTVYVVALEELGTPPEAPGR